MKTNGLSKELLKKLKLIELFNKDFQENNPVIKEYLEVFTGNFILKNLNWEDRMTLYSILNNSEITRALELLNEKIPFLRKKLYLELKSQLKEILNEK